MGLAELRTAIGHAKVDTRLITLSIPNDLFSAMSAHARFFVLYMTDSPTSAPALGLLDILPPDWDNDARNRFIELHDVAPDAQMEVLAFITAIQHEFIHYLDLLTTPFAVNMHTKAVLEYLLLGSLAGAFLENPTEPLGQPLADYLSETNTVGWLNDNPGADPTTEDARRQALGGKIAFDDYTRGAPPRRVESGWGSDAGVSSTIILNGHEYQPVTVNGIWPTVKTANGEYFGPYELLEGRALTLVLRYLRHLLRDLPDRNDIILRYVSTFYPPSLRRYRFLIELVSGRPLEDVLTLPDSQETDTLLMLSQGVSWYALNGPPPLGPQLVAPALPTLRFILALMAWDSYDAAQPTVVDFLQAVDSTPVCKSFGFVDADKSLDICLEWLDATSSCIGAITRPGIRDHYNSILSCQTEAVRERFGSGYASLYGNPEHGNPVDGLDDSLEGALQRISEEIPEMSAWLRDRTTVLYADGVSLQARVDALRSWWPAGSNELASWQDSWKHASTFSNGVLSHRWVFAVTARTRETAVALGKIVREVSKNSARLRTEQGRVIIEFPREEFPGDSSPFADLSVQSFLRYLFEEIPYLLYFLSRKPRLAALTMAVAAFAPQALAYDGDRAGFYSESAALKVIAILERNAVVFAQEHDQSEKGVLKHLGELDENSRDEVEGYMAAIQSPPSDA